MYILLLVFRKRASESGLVPFKLEHDEATFTQLIYNNTSTTM